MRSRRRGITFLVATSDFSVQLSICVIWFNSHSKCERFSDIQSKSRYCIWGCSIVVFPLHWVQRSVRFWGCLALHLPNRNRLLLNHHSKSIFPGLMSFHEHLSTSDLKHKTKHQAYRNFILLKLYEEYWYVPVIYDPCSISIHWDLCKKKRSKTIQGDVLSICQDRCWDCRKWSKMHGSAISTTGCRESRDRSRYFR